MAERGTTPETHDVKRTNIKRKLAAVAAGLAIAGAVGASATSLGGVDSNELGADTTDVSACDSDGIDVDWEPVFNPGLGEYVAYFTLSDIDTDCLATPYKITIYQTGPGGFSAAGSFSQFQFFTRYNRASDGEEVVRAGYRSNFSAELVDGIAIVISG